MRPKPVKPSQIKTLPYYKHNCKCIRCNGSMDLKKIMNHNYLFNCPRCNVWRLVDHNNPEIEVLDISPEAAKKRTEKVKEKKEKKSGL